MDNDLIIGGPYPIQLPNGINSFTWGYQLRTIVEETIGGKVTQVLGVNITSATITAEIGSGGYPALKRISQAARDLIIWQSETRKPVKLAYPKRKYSFMAFLKAVNIKDSLDNVTFPITFLFEIDEDVSGIASATSFQAEINRLQEGVGYKRNQYNDPDFKPQSSTPGGKTAARAE